MNYNELYDKRLEQAPGGNRSGVGEKVFYEYSRMRNIPIKKPYVKRSAGYKFRLIRKSDGGVIKTYQKVGDLQLAMANGEIMQYSRDPDFVNEEDKEFIVHKRQDRSGGSQDLALKEELETLRMWEDYIKQYPLNGWRMIWVADGKRYKSASFKLLNRMWNSNYENTEITNGEDYKRYKYPDASYRGSDVVDLFE